MKSSDFKTFDQKLASVVDYLCDKGRPDSTLAGSIAHYKAGLRSLGITLTSVEEMRFGEYEGCWRIRGLIEGNSFEYYI